MKLSRVSGRSFDEMRPLKLDYGIYEYSPGSVLISLGRTKVLCAITLEQGVPAFLRGKGVGWLSAEYAMLPAATSVRSARESSSGLRNGRSVEISRLIGRVLRTVVDTKTLGERTILVDCDVLQADGGTRSASISGAFAALQMAQSYWLANRVIREPILVDQLASISVGIVQQQPMLDPDYQEDSGGNGDFNFVITRSGHLVEIQGGAEKKPISDVIFDQARHFAKKGINEIFNSFDMHKHEHPTLESNSKERVPFFSLHNRLSQTS